jgi:hypothetical protein
VGRSIGGDQAAEGANVRFGISHVLDAIERRISTDPTAAGGVVDLGEVVRRADLDGGRPAHLLRLGLVVDALSRHLSDSQVSVYAVADRSLMSDTDLTANERMVIRRWSDDGKVEVVRNGGPSAALRAREVAALTGLPLLSRHTSGYPGLAYSAVGSPNGISLIPQMIGPGPSAPAPVLGRQWRCPEPGCASFGPPGVREPDPFAPPRDQVEPVEPGLPPPPQLMSGVPTCARHGTPLTDLGPRPRAVTLAARVDGVVWHRFLLAEGAPVPVGRAPEDPDGVTIGLALDERGLRWVSRSHVRFELRGHTVHVIDTSTNGTTVLLRPGPVEQPRRTPLGRGEGTTLTEWDTVELYEGIELGRADRSAGPVAGAQTGSVMADAPTQAIRLN